MDDTTSLCPHPRDCDITAPEPLAAARPPRAHPAPWYARLFARVDIASLVWFRIAFGPVDLAPGAGASRVDGRRVRGHGQGRSSAQELRGLERCLVFSRRFCGNGARVRGRASGSGCPCALGPGSGSPSTMSIPLDKRSAPRSRRGPPHLPVAMLALALAMFACDEDGAPADDVNTRRRRTTIPWAAAPRMALVNLG
jgi:hypothetical protein